MPAGPRHLPATVAGADGPSGRSAASPDASTGSTGPDGTVGPASPADTLGSAGHDLDQPGRPPLHHPPQQTPHL